MGYTHRYRFVGLVAALHAPETLNPHSNILQSTLLCGQALLTVHFDFRRLRHVLPMGTPRILIRDVWGLRVYGFRVKGYGAYMDLMPVGYQRTWVQGWRVFVGVWTTCYYSALGTRPPKDIKMCPETEYLVDLTHRKTGSIIYM